MPVWLLAFPVTGCFRLPYREDRLYRPGRGHRKPDSLGTLAIWLASSFSAARISASAALAAAWSLASAAFTWLSWPLISVIRASTWDCWDFSSALAASCSALASFCSWRAVSKAVLSASICSRMAMSSFITWLS